MTENLERLLVVARKRAAASEIEIAREVQNQLYPRIVPKTRTLRLTAICQPARMVSGDYYDYECIRDSQVALAIGDVAGKEFGRALMATLQSSLRKQYRIDGTRGGGGTELDQGVHVAPGRVEQSAHAYTCRKKYATFCLGVFDEPNATFTYTKPVIFRRWFVKESASVGRERHRGGERSRFPIREAASK